MNNYNMICRAVILAFVVAFVGIFLYLKQNKSITFHQSLIYIFISIFVGSFIILSLQLFNTQRPLDDSNCKICSFPINNKELHKNCSVNGTCTTPKEHFTQQPQCSKPQEEDKKIEKEEPVKRSQCKINNEEIKIKKEEPIRRSQCKINNEEKEEPVRRSQHRINDEENKIEKEETNGRPLHRVNNDESEEQEKKTSDRNRPDAIAEKDYWRTRYGTNNNYDTDFGGMFYDGNPFYNRYNNEDSISSKEDLEDMRRRELRENSRIKRLRADIDDREHTIDGYETPYQKVGVKSEKHRVYRNRRAIEGPLDDELPYSDYNHLPVAAGYKSKAYEYGYSFLPPEKWYPQPPRPPVCVTEKRCPVCPVTADGTPTDVKEFHESRRVTQPDSINTAYIEDKLNAGR